MGTFLLSEGRRCEGENRPEGRRTDSGKYRRIRHFVIASSLSSPIHASFRTAQSGTVDSTSMRSCFWGVGKAPRIGGQYNLCVVLASYTRCIGPIFAKKKIRFVIHSWEVKARGPPHYPTSPALVKGAPDCNSVNRGWDRKGVSLMGYRRRIRFDDGPYSSDINLLHSILFSSF